MTAMPDRVEGLLLIDKPSGMTSHDVVDVVRRTYGERSIGHLGTLDPFATGLLVLLLGRSTRLANFIDGEPKVYEAAIRFGTETDTDDCTGQETRSAPLPSAESVALAVRKLTGPIAQIPPTFSAKKVAGVPAYRAARAGDPVELEPVEVIVHEWSNVAFQGDTVSATVTCSAGTYIRALARDLGRLTNSAAHLTALRRTRAGAFDVGEAHPLDRLVEQRPAPRTLRVMVD
jgi:tRNA pseudouridine55 synthase